MEEKTQEVYHELEHQRVADQKETDKKLQQIKFDQQELLMESTDNHKREMRELKYSVEKNAEDVETLASTIKSLKRRNEEPADSSRLKKSDSQLSTSITQKVDDKLEDKVKKLKDELKNEIKKQNENYIDECIEFNNKNFVVPTVERHCEQNIKVQEKDSRVQNEPRASLPQKLPVSDKEIEEKCEKIIAKKLRPE